MTAIILSHGTQTSPPGNAQNATDDLPPFTQLVIDILLSLIIFIILLIFFPGKVPTASIVGLIVLTMTWGACVVPLLDVGVKVGETTVRGSKKRAGHEDAKSNIPSPQAIITNEEEWVDLETFDVLDAQVKQTLASARPAPDLPSHFRAVATVLVPVFLNNVVCITLTSLGLFEVGSFWLYLCSCGVGLLGSRCLRHFMGNNTKELGINSAGIIDEGGESEEDFIEVVDLGNDKGC